MRNIMLIATVLFMGTSFAHATDTEYTMRVDGVTCPFCVATSEKELKKIDGVRAVSSNLKAGTIIVCADDSVKFTDDQLRELFLEKGFTYRGMTVAEQCQPE